MADAQLGSVGNFNLGGYIPAPQRQTPLWQAALANMLGQAGGQVAGAAVDRFTAPDPYSPEGHGLHRAWNPSEVSQAAQTGIAKGAADETKRHNAETESIARGGQAVGLALGKGEQDLKGRELDQGDARLNIIRQQIADEKDEKQRDFLIKLYNAELGFRELGMKGREQPSRIELNQAQADAYKAMVPTREATGDLNRSKAQDLEELRKLRQRLSSQFLQPNQ